MANQGFLDFNLLSICMIYLIYRYFYNCCSSSSENLQKLQENHNNVEVEDHGSDNVIVNAQFVASTTNDQLSIDKQEDAVDNDKSAACEGVPRLSIGEYDPRNEAHNHRNRANDDKAKAEEWAAQRREV